MLCMAQIITIICVTYVQKNIRFELELSSHQQYNKFSRYGKKIQKLTKTVI